jgi:hypothetical protein
MRFWKKVQSKTREDGLRRGEITWGGWQVAVVAVMATATMVETTGMEAGNSGITQSGQLQKRQLAFFLFLPLIRLAYRRGPRFGEVSPEQDGAVMMV